MTPIEALLHYFRTGTAEEDRSFLDRAFITHDQMAELLAVQPGTMRILAGSKGIGKTALFEWLVKISNRNHLPALLLRPDNLYLAELGSATDIGTLKRAFYNALVGAISAELGRQLKGYLTGAKATLYRASVEAGVRDPDGVGKLLEVLTALSVPVAQVNGVKLAKELSGTPKPDTLMRAISEHLLSSGTIIFLLIDDTDQVASPQETAQLNRIWAVLLAVRRLAGECSALRCVVSLRSEVWSRLQSETAGQLDQIDHLRGMVVPLRATDDFIERVILRRLQLAADDIHKHGTDPFQIFFEGHHVILPTSDQTRLWSDFIVKSARERPRDAIQLVKILAEQARASGRQKIADKDADKGMKTYSAERVSDAANEFHRDCEHLRRVIESYARVPFEIPFEQLREHLKTVGSGFSLVVRGEIIKPGDDDDAIRLLRFLHEVGFINARVPDARKPKDFRHINFQDNPHFVERANWNEMQAATWEIHPAFRSFLIARREDAFWRK